MADDADMKYDPKKIMSIPCPTCGAKAGEKCELSTGLPRTEPHRDRRLATLDIPKKDLSALASPNQPMATEPASSTNDSLSFHEPLPIELPAIVTIIPKGPFVAL